MTKKVKAELVWCAPMKGMTIPAVVPNSIEYTFIQINLDSFYLIFNEEERMKNT